MNDLEHQHPEPVDEVGLLTDAIITGMASQEQRQRLNDLVMQSEDARWAYVKYVHDTVSIHRRSRETTFLQELNLLVDHPKDDDSSSDRTPHKTSGRILSCKQLASRMLSWARRNPSLITACCLLLVVSVWTFRNSDSKSASSHGKFARIIEETDCRWLMDGKAISLTKGEWLNTGRYRLESGLAKVLFPWGTEATLEAPIEFEFTEDGSKRLWQGQLVAKVSPEDTGFTIDTPSMKLIDLGTEFGVSTNADGDSEVHVFKGAVEVRPLFAEADSLERSITLFTGEAKGFVSSKLPVRQVAFNPKRFSKAWRMNGRVSETSGAIRFHHPAPASVVEGATESNDTMALFLEREKVTTNSVAVTVTEPGLFTTFNNRTAWLNAGMTVDSYLIHFDPTGSRNTQPPVTVEGTVTFDRPILAVIARGDQLAASDCYFSSPGTHYQASPIFRSRLGESFKANITPSYATRGLNGLWNVSYSHESPAPNDWLRLSADRRTLTVHCTAGGETDQLRILVSSEEEIPASFAASTTALTPQPFHGRPFDVSQTIEAEDFDLGGQDVAYYDTTPDCLSNVYRGNESVELKQYHMGESTHTCVSLARAGEWLNYTIKVDQPGEYVLMARTGSQLAGGKFRFELEAPDHDPLVTSSLNVPVTSLERNSHDHWFGTVQAEPVSLQPGVYRLRVVMESNHTSGRLGNFDWFRIEPLSVNSAAANE